MPNGVNQFDRGVIIVHPHGSMIASGEKKLVIKSKKFESIVGKPLLLIQSKEALGIIKLVGLKEIDLKQFRALRSLHRITEEERKKWWPGKTVFYQYTVRRVNIFTAPVRVEYPTGPQVFIEPKNIKPLQHIYIGTSGYDYDWWKPYYMGEAEAAELDTKNKLQIYANEFNSLELNGSFYKMYSSNAWTHLKESVDGGFIFSVKVNRSITQYRQIQKFPQFWNSVKHLLPKLKCLLFQFPKNFKYSEHNLELLRRLDIPIRAAFEFRDREWFRDDVYRLFRHKKKWSIVISYVHIHDWEGYNLDDKFNPPLADWQATSDFVYFRMHGSTGKYTGSQKNVIKPIIHFIRHSQLNAFVYFNNTDSAYSGNVPDAIHDCKYLQYKIGLL